MTLLEDIAHTLKIPLPETLTLDAFLKKGFNFNGIVEQIVEALGLTEAFAALPTLDDIVTMVGGWIDENVEKLSEFDFDTSINSVIESWFTTNVVPLITFDTLNLSNIWDSIREDALNKLVTFFNKATIGWRYHG